MIDLDPILLARIQFAFTISFHIVFPAFTIGLASFLAVVEWRWLATGDERFRKLYKHLPLTLFWPLLAYEISPPVLVNTYVAKYKGKY